MGLFDNRLELHIQTCQSWSLLIVSLIDLLWDTYRVLCFRPISDVTFKLLILKFTIGLDLPRETEIEQVSHGFCMN